MKQLFRYNIFLTLTFVITVSCNTTPRVIYEEKGLVKGKPGMNRYTEVEAGESSLLEKPYFIAPNLIPHSIVDFSITKESNDCLDCHLEGEELDEGHIATKVPDSHFLNEFKNEQEEENVTGVRYNCLQCHVLQAELGVSN